MIAVAVALFLQGSPVNGNLATQLEGTYFLENYRSRNSGVLTGCGIEFDVFVRDHRYRNGELVSVRGSLETIEAEPGRTMEILKIGLRDLQVTPNGTWLFDDQQVQHAYFISKITGEPYPAAEQFTCENGGACILLSQDHFLDAIGQLALNGHVTGAFTRMGGSLDQVFIIEATNPNIGRTYDPLGFFECVEALYGD